MIRDRIHPWVRARSRKERAAIVIGFALFWYSGRFWVPDQAAMSDQMVLLFAPIVVVFLLFFYTAVYALYAEVKGLEPSGEGASEGDGGHSDGI